MRITRLRPSVGTFISIRVNIGFIGLFSGFYVTIIVFLFIGKEDLFLKCPLYGKIPKCLVFYRYKVPFKIPCRALHPAISVAEHTTNLHKV